MNMIGRAAALMLALLIPGAQANTAMAGIADESSTALTATPTPGAQPEPSPDAAQVARLTQEEFMLALGMEPPLGEIDAKVVETLYGYYVSVSELLDSVRAAIPANEADIDVMKFVALERELDSLDDKMDSFEDTLEATYRAGDISREKHRFYKDELEYMEDALDEAEDVLDVVHDDDDDDDDDDDGWRAGRTPLERMQAMSDRLALEYPHEPYHDD